VVFFLWHAHPARAFQNPDFSFPVLVLRTLHSALPLIRLSPPTSVGRPSPLGTLSRGWRFLLSNRGLALPNFSVFREKKVCAGRQNHAGLF
jgi:hypothetical protein